MPDLLLATAMNDVVVVGAGVVGLTCAVRMLEAGALARAVSV